MKSDFLGGAIAIGAAFMSIFGVSLQKYSFDQEEKRTVQRPIFLRPLWWVGMLCVVGASLGDFLALGFAPQTLVASLGGGSTILGNMLLSRFWLKQALYYTDIIGACFVTMGVVTLACASVSEPGHYKMDKIYQLMQAAPFILYCFITTAFVMTLYLRVRRSKAPALRVAASSSTSSATTSASSTPSSTTTSVTEPQHPESVRLQPVPSRDTAATVPESETPDNSDAGSSTTTPKSGAATTTNGQTKTHQRSALMSPFPSPIYGETLSLSPARLAGEEDDVLDDDMMDHVELTKTSSFNRKHLDVEIEKHTLIIDPNLPLYWAAISGTIGAQSLLLAKCVVEMISSTINGDNQFVYFGTYVIVGAMVATLLSQTHTLNLAIELGDTMSAYPVFQAFWISMSNVSGIVFFQQTGEFTSTQWMLFPTAIVFVVVGMTLLAKHEKFGNRVKYSVAMPISLSSPRQHDIVAQSFVFRVLTPQRQLADDADDDFDAKSFGQSPRRRRASVDTAV